MKKMRLLFTLLIAAAFASLSFGQITGTAHDFSGEAWSGGEICIACHTPHDGDMSIPGAPLWNHEVSTATFTLYTGGGTMDATMGQPSAQSMLCLSCHDGTVALDSYGGVAGGTYLIGTDDGYVGTDLSDDHPISFTYDDALATTDGALFYPSTDLSGLGGTIDADLLFGGQVQCASCHDVHGSTGFASLLRIENAGSALCLTCHNK